MKYLVVTLTSFILSGCAAPIQHNKVNDNKYWIRINGTGADNMQTVEAKWRAQAEKLCGSRGYTTTDLESDVNMSSGVDVAALMVGAVIPTDNHRPYAFGHANCN